MFGLCCGDCLQDLLGDFLGCPHVLDHLVMWFFVPCAAFIVCEGVRSGSEMVAEMAGGQKVDGSGRRMVRKSKKEGKRKTIWTHPY